uniref:PITH domain-containing protein n=1 Tax=Caenorhabditis tropicalis TaxID=1561998 RepID=A0A1I7TK27_9PELO
MFEKRKENSCQFIPESSIPGVNKVKLYVEPSFFQSSERKKFEPGSERIDFSADPRFQASMKLIQNPGRGWSLHLEDDVEQNIPLMLMTGVIRPRSVAQNSLEIDGELVAFSSFIEINGTDMCLDRRELHDFSKYIPHSCEPTCSVRLVDSGNNIPDLVVYSLQPIDSFDFHAITLNYFKMFQSTNKTANKKLKKTNIFSLYDEKINFVQCLCGSVNCLRVPYISEKTDEVRKPPMKKFKTSEVY